MARWLATLVALIPAVAFAGVSASDVDRVVSGIYAAEVGAATGDVDADGGAMSSEP
jgi:hypothetical protein